MSEEHGHGHTHVTAAAIGSPPDHSHVVAPAVPHFHRHDEHDRAALQVLPPEEQPAPDGGATPALRVNGICAGYYGRDVLDEVSFAVRPGEFVGVIGPNGSGKTTLLKVIAGLLPTQCGSIEIFGAPATPRQRRQIGYVPQIELVNWSFPVTVYDVVLMGRYGRLGMFRRPTRDDERAVHSALEEVGMLGRTRSQIGELSGGQQQRAFIARALVQEPRVLLLDEPIAGVDAASQHAIFTLLEARQQHGMTIVATTHDLSCVATWFDRVLCLNHRVIAYGTPTQVLNDEVLSATYGSHVLVIPEAAAAP